MAFPASGLFVQTFLTGLNGGIVLDMDLTSHKVALFTNSMTGADLTSDTAYGVGAWASNEVANGSGYATGGYTLANTTWTHTGTGVVAWKNTVDPNWPSASFTAHGGLYYADALAGNNAICAQTFGADITATNGTFTIVLSSSTIFTIDFVP